MDPLLISQPAAAQPYIFIRINRRFERLDFTDLVYVESCRGYLKLITLKGSVMLHTTMRGLEDALPQHLFCRIHRGYIVAIDRVSSFDKHEVSIKYGEQVRKLPIGNDRYKNSLLERVVAVGDIAAKAPPVLAVAHG